MEFTWRWKINNPNWYCGSKVVNGRVKSKFQDLTILRTICFLSDENMQNATHSEKRRMAILPAAPLYILSRITNFFFVNPQLELLKHKYKNFQNIDQRYPWLRPIIPINIAESTFLYDCTEPAYKIRDQYATYPGPILIQLEMPPDVRTAACDQPVINRGAQKYYTIVDHIFIFQNTLKILKTFPIPSIVSLVHSSDRILYLDFTIIEFHNLFFNFLKSLVPFSLFESK